MGSIFKNLTSQHSIIPSISILMRNTVDYHLMANTKDKWCRDYISIQL